MADRPLENAQGATAPAEEGRVNQKRRTRKELLQAAARLLKQGRKPSLEEVAAEALVSRATAYRYFPSVEALHREAAIDLAVPTPEVLFAGVASTDPLERLELVDSALHDMTLAAEVPLRLMLAQVLEHSASPTADPGVPLRQNRRAPLLEAALAPASEQFTPAMHKTLVNALSLIVGVDGVLVVKDVLRLGDAEARAMKRWAIRALVEAATMPR